MALAILVLEKLGLSSMKPVSETIASLTVDSVLSCSPTILFGVKTLKSTLHPFTNGCGSFNWQMNCNPPFFVPVVKGEEYIGKLLYILNVKYLLNFIFNFILLLDLTLNPSPLILKKLKEEVNRGRKSRTLIFRVMEPFTQPFTQPFTLHPCY